MIKQAQWSPPNGEVSLYTATVWKTLSLSDIGKHYSVFQSGPEGTANYDGTLSDFIKNEWSDEWRHPADVPDDPNNLTTAPPECYDAETDKYICLNYIYNIGKFDIVLYSDNGATKTCDIFPNGLIADTPGSVDYEYFADYFSWRSRIIQNGYYPKAILIKRLNAVEPFNHKKVQRQTLHFFV